jgi:hypothetical protein
MLKGTEAKEMTPMENDLFLLHLRIAVVLDPHAFPKAAEVEELLDDIKAVLASCSQRPPAHAKALRYWLSGAKDKSNCTLLERVESRLRERQRHEDDAREREAYMARVAQRDRESRMAPVDRGTPGYAKGA